MKSSEVIMDEFTRKALCMSVILAGHGSEITVEQAYEIVNKIEEEIMERC